jgi:hypothetical protein
MRPTVPTPSSTPDLTVARRQRRALVAAAVGAAVAGWPFRVDASVSAPASRGEAPADAAATAPPPELLQSWRRRPHLQGEGRLRFLGHPDDWVSGDGVRLLDLPPVLLEPGDSATLRLGWTPGLEGARAGHLSLPHDQTGSPFTLELAVETGPPLRLVLVGEGRRVSSTADYGLSFLQDDCTI